MLTRLRSGWLAGTGALFLVLSMSGVVMGATVLTAVPGPDAVVSDPAADTDTTLTFEDADGNGIDDDCQAVVEADPAAALAAENAVDLDGDGVISVSEAARSGRVGGKNCTHGGYVSLVARAADDACDSGETGDGDTDDGNTGGDASTGLPNAFDVDDLDQPAADEDAAPACADDEDEGEDSAECEEAAGPEPPTEFTNVGAWVSAVARSDAVGGKNCNHGGAVSKAAKEAQEARDAARDARKAEQQSARDARAAERQAAKDARAAERAAAKATRAAEREAAKAARQNGNGKGHGNDD